MGRKDRAFYDYLSRAEVFADFCNGCIYAGQRVISPQELAESQRTYIPKQKMRDGRIRRTAPRERDVNRLLCRKSHFIKIAVESQDSIDFCMPVRCMGYDGLEFSQQIRTLRRALREAKLLKPGAEYLSGIRETDRLIPAVTIVFYHGEGKWTAARHLQELLDMEGADEVLRPMVSDYRLNLVCVEELREENFETGLRELVALTKRRKDKTEFLRYCEAHADRLGRLDEDTYDFLCIMLDMTRLLQKKKKEKCKNQNGRGYDMCLAAQGIYEDGVKDGEKRGIEIGEKRGIEVGEDRLARLLRCLKRDNRSEDFSMAIEDDVRRKTLYLEYGI